MSDFLSPTDAFIWAIDRDPRLRSTIVTVTLLAEPPKWDDVLHRFDRLTRALSVFRRRVVGSPAPVPPRWQDDDDFDLSFHVRRITATGPGSLDVVLELARVAAMSDFDRARPLWEVLLIDGLAGGGSALLCKMHHALTDGMGAVDLAAQLFSDTGHEDHEQDPTSLQQHDLLADMDRVGTALTAVVRTVPHVAATAALHPVHTLNSTLSTGMSMVRIVRPSGGPRSPIMRRRTLSRRVGVLEVSRSALHQAGAVADGSLNDAFLAAIAEGLRLYHEKHGVSIRELLLTMPVNIRHESDQPGGNRTSLLRFDLPTGVRNAAARIRFIHQRTQSARHEKSLGFASLTAAAMNLAPNRYVSSVLRHVDVIASDVPGFRDPRVFAGVPVSAQYAFSPTLGAALNITLLTYVDTCGIGLNVDTGAIPDFDVFRSCIAAGFDDVLALCTVNRPAGSFDR